MSRIARIIGAGQYIPKKVVKSDELEEEMNFQKLGVRKGTIKILNGVDERHFAEEGENSSDLAAKAGIDALRNANMNPEEIQLLIFASISQDFLEPATVNAVQYKIGASSAKCFDVKNACNAFITAVEIADMYIRSGNVNTAMVVAGEVMHKYIRWTYGNADEVGETNATLGFGDGGGAVILKSAEGDDGILTRFETHGKYWDEGVIWGGGTMYMADSEKFYMKNMNPDMVQTNTLRAVKFYYDSMRDTKVNVEDVDLFLTTQMSKYAVLKCADALKIPHDKVVTQMTKLGNTAAASMPIALSRALDSGRLEIGKNQRIVFLGAANGLTLGYATAVI